MPPPVSAKTVRHFCEKEWALHLDDVMIRRSSWRRYHPNAATIAEQAAVWMGEVLGWDASVQQAELERYRNYAD